MVLKYLGLLESLKTCPPIIGHGASGLTFYETELKEGVFDGFLNKPVQSDNWKIF